MRRLIPFGDQPMHTGLTLWAIDLPERSEGVLAMCLHLHCTKILRPLGKKLSQLARISRSLPAAILELNASIFR